MTTRTIRAAYAGGAALGFGAVGFAAFGPFGVALGPAIILAMRWHQMRTAGAATV